MNITFTLNNKAVSADIAPDTLLLDLVRRLGCKSVKRGCGTGNCGLCTVYLDGTPILSCATLAARVQGRSVTTLDPTVEEIKEYLAGNLCRCSGYEGQLRAIQSFLAWKKAKEAGE